MFIATPTGGNTCPAIKVSSSKSKLRDDYSGEISLPSSIMKVVNRY